MKSYFIVKGQEIDPEFAVLLGEIDGDQIFEFDENESAEYYGIAEQLRKLKDKSGNPIIQTMICVGSKAISVCVDEDNINEDGTLNMYEDWRYKLVVSNPEHPIIIRKTGCFFEIKNMHSDNKYHYWNE